MFPTNAVELSISPFNSITFCFKYFDGLSLDVWMFNYIFSLYWDLYEYIMSLSVSRNLFYVDSILSDISTATPATHWLLSA